ncbi:MAG: putative DNA binding domain-containing protein [Phycisphaerae bacterium]|nr:putative DNA binding domain-containing protein [Phycisphaerae bacterium]
MKNHIQRALTAKRESKYVDFKVSLDFSEPHAWCEIVKDIIAMANSGGGVLLIGLDNKGNPTGFDPTPVLDVDEAVMTDRIQKYTGVQFDAFTISEEAKSGNRLAAILVEGGSIPIVFTKPGTYAVSDKKQKTAFSAGTVYFRHGAKSEPGDTNDLRKVVERQLESIRQSWLQGMRKVVKAPPGSQIYTLPSGVEVREFASSDARAIRIVDDPDAPAYRKLDYDLTHPFRQKETIAEINRGLADRTTINSFDIQCINRVYKVWDEDKFCHCPRYSSPQYSREYVAWVISQYQQDSEFFQKTRETDYEQRH